MMSTLNLTRRAIHNRAVAESLQAVRDSIEQGGGMEEPLRASAEVIPPVVTDMLVTGEESGRVDAIAEQIADIYEEEVRIAVNSLAEVLQPIFTVIIGGAVAALFISLFYPIVSMVQQISSSSGN
ncbi:MAG TPA: type II secretion system F family protein, partial [Candidatus Hydrogenedentes bacterium]|nr:type II secretion system F family protein [Candidatus Hydrogenedentota bacterium]